MAARPAIGFFRRRAAGAAGESALRHFRGHTFRGFASHLRLVIGVAVGIFRICGQRAAQQKHGRKHDRKKSFHSEFLLIWPAGRSRFLSDLKKEASLTADDVSVREVD